MVTHVNPGDCTVARLLVSPFVASLILRPAHLWASSVWLVFVSLRHAKMPSVFRVPHETFVFFSFWQPARTALHCTALAPGVPDVERLSTPNTSHY